MIFKNKLICLLTAAAALICCSGCMLSGTNINDNSDIIRTHESTSSIYISDDSISGVTDNSTELHDENSISEIINYYTSSLNKKELTVFSEIYSGIMAYQKEIDIKGGIIKADDIGDFLTFLTSVCSEIHHLSGNYGLYTDENGFVTGLEMNYSRSKETGKAELDVLNKKITQICGKVSSLSDYDKIKFLHDYIVKNCSYDPMVKTFILLTAV